MVFHAAAVWDREAKEARLFLNGQNVGTEVVPDNTYFKNIAQYSFYYIGLKRDTFYSLRGYLRDLMIIRRALTGEELSSIAGQYQNYKSVK